VTFHDTLLGTAFATIFISAALIEHTVHVGHQMIAIVNDLHTSLGIELYCLQISAAHVHCDGFKLCLPGPFDFFENGLETFGVESIGAVDDLTGL